MNIYQKYSEIKRKKKLRLYIDEKFNATTNLNIENCIKCNDNSCKKIINLKHL